MSDKKQSRLIPIPHWNNYHPWPTPNTIRNYIANRHMNGFERVLKRVGSRRILIDENAFFEWVEEQSKKNRRD